MAEDPVPTPNPYLDPQNEATLVRAGKILGGASYLNLPIAQQRKLLNEIQSPAPPNPGISISQIQVLTTHGRVKVFIYRPRGKEHEQLPFIYHLHGGGYFAFGPFAYERFDFDLVTRTGYALVFPEYTLAPQAKFPVQQEQCLEVLQHVVSHGHEERLSTKKIVVLGDSAGGQLAPALSILNHQRSLGLPITHQFLLHPVVNATSLTANYSEYLFQNGPLITSAFMTEVFKEEYENDKDRKEITASPIFMTKEQAKEYMPPTTIITSQCEWLRDQAQNFGKLLQQAGVSCGVVQEMASLHDAEVLEIARKSPTAELVMIVIAGKTREVLGGNEGVETNGHAAEEEKPSKKRRRA